MYLVLRVMPWLLASSVIAASAAAQPVPRPFPRPGGRAPDTTPPPAAEAELAPGPTAQPASSGTEAPSEAALGFPVYPNATYVASYDAGRGQQYHLFGTNATFQDMVNYYSAILRERGDRVFDEPPVHMFEVGNFREETMAFPPGVTIKDYTWNGAAGYPNAVPGAEPSHYRTIVQIVPAPVGGR